ncbi:MAG: PIN domain-containing protein [Paracoccaceae bacterium]
MPIVDDDEIRRLLAEGGIGALSIDTNVFDAKGLQLKSPALLAIAELRRKPFPFVLSGTVAREVIAHLKKDGEDAIREARRSIGKALNAFEITAPTRDDLLNQITGGKSSSDAARERFDSFVKRSACLIIDDASMVDTTTLFDGYFDGTPPFGVGKKKNEFPDALALNALEAYAGQQRLDILVVSRDKDWKAFCHESERLYLVEDVERALSLVNNAAELLRSVAMSWVAVDGLGYDEVCSHITYDAEKISFTADGNSTSGAMEAVAWDGQVTEIHWPSSAEIDIIQFGKAEDENALEVVLSLPVTLFIRVPVELSFSAFDSIDRESISMGGREEEIDEEVEARATVTLQVFDLGDEDEDVVFVESEIDVKDVDIYLSDVDVFPPEDYWEADDGK